MQEIYLKRVSVTLSGKRQGMQELQLSSGTEEQTQKIKFEFLDSQVFQVISRYVEIDGRPYVMEMIQNLDESIQIDQEGYEKLISKLSGYNEKLYTDVLTGIYNRRFLKKRSKRWRMKPELQ